MRWLQDKKRDKQKLEEKRRIVDEDMKERDKAIQKEYKAYERRVALKDKLEAETEIERMIRLKYYNKRGQPLKITSQHIQNAFSVEDLEQYRKDVQIKMLERNG